jgi:hypothetical protein
MHFSIMDGIHPIVPALVCNPSTRIGGKSIPNHLFTAPPEVSAVAKSILASVGVKHDKSQAIVWDMHTDFVELFTASIVLKITERLLQEIGLKTMARAVKKDRQHIEMLPFTMLAMVSCLVSVLQAFF